MPNYINPFSSSSNGTTSPFSSMGTISPMTSSMGTTSPFSSMGTISPMVTAQSFPNAWGNKIATRSKIKLSEIVNRAKIGTGTFGGSFNSGTGKFGGSFNSGAGTFGGSNVSSSNSRSFNNYGRTETSLTSTFKRKPTVKRYGYGLTLTRKNPMFFNMDNAKGIKNHYGPLAQGTI